MKNKIRMTRRGFLKFAAAGSAFVLSRLTTPFSIQSTENANTPDKNTPHTPVPDVDIILRAARETFSILPGKPTPVWAYRGELLSGPDGTLATFDGSYLGSLRKMPERLLYREKILKSI